MGQTLEKLISKRVSRKRADVFLRSDFRDLGGYDQVGRVLRQLVQDGRLMKIGQGVYARAIKSPFGNQTIPAKGLQTLTEALNKLGVQTTATRMEQAYNAGKITQVPSGRVVGVTRRVRRKIGYNGITLSFERAKPAAR